MKIIKSFSVASPFIRLLSSTLPKLILTIIILTVIVNINSCNGISEPEIQPGRRDYVWKVDTINPGNESLYLLRLWGSAPNNVWAVGASSWSATAIWHYDGVNWNCDSISRKINPSGLFGISSKEVWLGNSNSTIWKYDGNDWYLFGEYKEEEFDATIIQSFDGHLNNIFAVGFKDSYKRNEQKAVLMNYDGNNWRFINIPNISAQFETMVIDGKSKDLIISGTIYDPKGFVTKVYCWDGKQMKELLSEIGGMAFVIKLGNETYVSYKSRIYKYYSKNLFLWKDNNDSSFNGNIICGRNKNDFFINTNIGIAHYNGKDSEIIYNYKPGHRVQVLIGMVFENDVFFIEHNFSIGRNLIIHGKLN